jgi:membrane protein insertase Oxa1/YidC/SpoIIIJ
MESSIHINFVAIAIAVVVNFVFGFIWYTPLFGKRWGLEMGFDMTQKPPAGALMKGMVVMVIGNFLTAWVLAHNMAAWTFVPDMKDSNALANGIMAGVFTWLGFFLPVDLGNVFWERKSWTLFFINTGYHLLSMIIVALIISHMPA